MAEYKVLITTSGLGSRLGSLTDYTNKSLVRVANKPAISYIIESYPIDCNFVITLGHFGSHVKQFLELAYPERQFTFVEIDKYKGEGSSLGYSILQCKYVIDCPFIFHASDTIISNYQLPDLQVNSVLGTYKENNSQYRTLNLSNGYLVKINEKGELGFDFSYIGVCGIKDFELFFKELKKLIYSKHEDTSDVHVINSMLSKCEFQYKDVGYDNWFDIGNASELSKTRKSFKSSINVLDKKDESIFFFDDFVIKFFADKTINGNRVARTNYLQGLVPAIQSHSENFYRYKKVEGNLFSKSVNSKSFQTLLEWSKENLWNPRPSEKFNEKCFDFYITKTKSRVDKYLAEFVDTQEVNSVRLPSIYDLIDSLNVNWISNGIPSQFHGDFILDNILETTDGFCLIDWRQDFAGNLDSGDVYYDLAKLNHNLTINHDLVNRNMFNASPESCYILTNSKLNECQEILHRFIIENGLDLNKVKVLTSLIWINMAPLHEYPFNNFLFNFGKYNLYKNVS